MGYFQKDCSAKEKTTQANSCWAKVVDKAIYKKMWLFKQNHCLQVRWINRNICIVLQNILTSQLKCQSYILQSREQGISWTPNYTLQACVDSVDSCGFLRVLLNRGTIEFNPFLIFLFWGSQLLFSLITAGQRGCLRGKGNDM